MRWPWVSRKDYDAIVDALQTAQLERYEASVLSADRLRKLGAEWDATRNGLHARIAELTAELEAEKQRARRRSRRNGADGPKPMAGPTLVRDANGEWVSGPVWVSPIDMRDATAATDEPKVAAPSPAVNKAIREVAGRDAPMSRHLRAFAEDQRELGVSEREIIRMIRQGEQVAL